jgi:hypothetical protein
MFHDLAAPAAVEMIGTVREILRRADRARCGNASFLTSGDPQPIGGRRKIKGRPRVGRRKR